MEDYESMETQERCEFAELAGGKKLCVCVFKKAGQSKAGGLKRKLHGQEKAFSRCFVGGCEYFGDVRFRDFLQRCGLATETEKKTKKTKNKANNSFV